MCKFLPKINQHFNCTDCNSKSVSLDWGAFGAALADMNNAIKNSRPTPNTNLNPFSADNYRPADSELRGDTCTSDKHTW